MEEYLWRSSARPPLGSGLASSSVSSLSVTSNELSKHEGKQSLSLFLAPQNEGFFLYFSYEQRNTEGLFIYPNLFNRVSASFLISFKPWPLSPARD